MAKCLILGSLIALAFAVWLAFNPVQNPGVQDCGSPLGFVIFTRTDVKVLPTETPGTAQLVLQPTCRERVGSQLLRAMIAFGAFLGLGMLGALIGLIDDRWQYYRAPRLESLLRERPSDAPGRLRAPPAVEEDELGVALPLVEGPDVVILFALTAFTVGGLVAFAGIDDTRDAIISAGGAGLIGLFVLVSLTFVVAGLQLVISEPLRAAQGQRKLPIGVPRAVELALAASAAQRLLPGLGPLGLDAHAISAVDCEERDVALGRLDSCQAIGLLVHLAATVIALMSAAIASRPEVALPSAWAALAIATGLLVFVGLARGPGRVRRLVVPPSLRAMRALVREAPSRAAAMFGLSSLLLVLNLTGFILSLSLAAAIEGGMPTSATVARVALVYLLACVVGAASPTPAGIGTFEPFAVLGLLLCGLLPYTAVAGVLLFRGATVWLPLIVGLAPFAWLKRRGAI